MSLVTIEPVKKSKKVVLVDQRYPYGVKKVYMSTALVAVAAQLMKAGYQVDIVDFNIDNPTDERVVKLFSQAGVIAVSVVGGPYLPQTIKLCRELKVRYSADVMVGGQVISKLTEYQFGKLFSGMAVFPCRSEDDLCSFFGPLESHYEISFIPVYERMGERLRKYLSTEFCLFLSQGCIYNCGYCSADKDKKERHQSIEVFRRDFEYLAQRAVEFGLSGLECYASPLDFWQNPQTIAMYMEVMSEVVRTKRIKFRMRALSCLNTFLKASRTLPNFAELVQVAGLWCIGFGVDGSDEKEWKKQGKVQNHSTDVARCLNVCKHLGVRAEVLMIMAYPESTGAEIWATVKNSFGYAWKWKNVVLRPYLAKTVLPGNKGWEIQLAEVELLLNNPGRFYDIDVCAIASSTTHPVRKQRWLGNLGYLSIVIGLSFFGKCATSPLLPQGQPGLYGAVAKLINRFMPFER